MYVWVMEILSGREKTIFGALPHLNFAFWGLAVAGIAYLIPNWHHMELVFSVPLIGLYVTYWVLPESPRWLLSQGRTEEAEEIVKKIENEEIVLTEEDKDEKQKSSETSTSCSEQHVAEVVEAKNMSVDHCEEINNAESEIVQEINQVIKRI